MSDKDMQLWRERERYVDAVAIRMVAWLEAQGIRLTDRGATQLSDVIRFETAP